MRSRGKLTRWGMAPVLVLLSALLFGGCDAKTPNTLDPKGPAALTESHLFWIILGIATFIFVVVAGALLYSIIRFRDRPGAAEPRQVSGNTRLEIAWTIAPSIVLFVVLAFTISYMYQVAQPANANGSVVHVRAIGHQWWWEFQYTDTNPEVVTGDELHVPVGTTVEVQLVSDNVIHSFWIPQLSGKTDVIPGHDNSMWFQADKTGNYRGECAEYCGTQHANMDFVVVADSQDTYQTWLSGQEAQALTPAPGTAEAAGLHDFETLGCLGCHTIDGVPHATAKVGPNLTHFGSRQLIAGGVLTNNQQNLTTWLTSPQAVKPGNDMVLPQPLNDQEISDLVAYLESLK